VTVWGVGMHVDMAIAPALFIVLVVWLFYRPPVRPLPLLVAGLMVLTVWSPYLKFEATRGFADMKSQLFLRSIVPEQYRQSWCDPTLMLATWPEPAGPAQRGTSAREARPSVTAESIGLSSRLGMLKDKLVSNFTHAVPIRGMNVFLMAVGLGTALLCTMPAVPTQGSAPAERGPPPQRRRALIAASLIAARPFALASTLFLLYHRRSERRGYAGASPLSGSS
jgi:hypothetical protein